MIPIKKFHNDYITIRNLLEFILLNEEYFSNLGIKLTKKSVNEGDNYFYVQGMRYKLELLDDTISIENVYITEDGDNWAQAEGYSSESLHLNGKSVKTNEVYDYLMNFKSIKRERNINKILK